MSEQIVDVNQTVAAVEATINVEQTVAVIEVTKETVKNGLVSLAKIQGKTEKEVFMDIFPEFKRNGGGPKK